MASARSSSKDLLNRISPGSPQDLLLRTGTGSCKDLLERNLAGSLQEPAVDRTYNENAPGQELENRAAVQTVCASLRSRKRTWTSHKSPFMRKFTMKMPQTKSSRTPLLRDFVQACAVEMNMSSLQCLGVLKASALTRHQIHWIYHSFQNHECSIS